jgi:heat shock protein HslJ
MALDDMDLIDAILDTARLVPDGHTSVPDISGLVDDSDVAPLMNQADLVWTPRCPPDSTCDMAPLEATDPSAGSVVPVGTTVTAADATPRPDVPPPVPAEDLDGDWAATVRFGQKVDEARQRLVTFTSAEKWSGTDGCNTLMGEYSVEADGSFEARVTGSTLKGCSPDDRFSDVDVVTTAEYVSLESDVLTFMSGDGEIIGEYRPVTANQVNVPNVVGLREKKAKQALTEVGLTSSVEGPAYDEIPTAPVVVVEQSPEAGQRVEHGSSVTLVMAESVLQQVTLTLFHCGINKVKFEGLFWERPWKDGPIIDGTRVPPGWVGTGTMTRIDKDEALYVDASGIEVPFRLAEDVRNHVCY